MAEEPVTPRQMLAAYARGYFPMAESREGSELYWYYPELRGVLPLEGFHVPRSLKKFLRDCPFDVTRNKAFGEVITACADMRAKGRTGTWINDEIIRLYSALAEKGFAHSVECWREGKLAGGLYGVSLGGAFFGESMFSHEENASKVALAHLAGHLKEKGFVLLDTQYVNEHLKQFGVQEIARKDYLIRLEQALAIDARF